MTRHENITAVWHCCVNCIDMRIHGRQTQSVNYIIKRNCAATRPQLKHVSVSFNPYHITAHAETSNLKKMNEHIGSKQENLRPFTMKYVSLM